MALCGIEMLMVIPRDGCYNITRGVPPCSTARDASDQERPDYGGSDGWGPLAAYSKIKCQTSTMFDSGYQQLSLSEVHQEIPVFIYRSLSV